MTAATDALAAATAAVTTEVGALSGQVSSLTATNASLTATNAAQAATITDQAAQIAALQAQIATPPTTGTPPLPAGWTKVVFSDFFEGTAVDTTKWNVRNNTTQSNMDGRNFARNCTVKNGYLSIRSGADTGDTAHPWSCGYLDTNGKSGFATGYWEARMRFPWGPTAVGYWPAFWLRPADGGIGEMDIMEAWPAKNDVHQSLWRDYTGTPHTEGPHQKIPPFDPTQWHVYAVQKEPGVCRFFIDGVQVWDASKSAAWVPEALDRNVAWKIRLNLQMGGGYGGKPTSATNLTQTFDVDYVRVLAR